MLTITSTQVTQAALEWEQTCRAAFDEARTASEIRAAIDRLEYEARVAEMDPYEIVDVEPLDDFATFRELIPSPLVADLLADETPW